MTQRAIKHALTERYYAWQEAEMLAKKDPEITLTANSVEYRDSEYMEEDNSVAEDGAEEVDEEVIIRPEEVVKSQSIPPEPKQVEKSPTAV